MANTFFSYSRLFSWYSCAAWLFAGLFGLGSSNRDYIRMGKSVGGWEIKQILYKMQEDGWRELQYKTNEAVATAHNIPKFTLGVWLWTKA